MTDPGRLETWALTCGCRVQVSVDGSEWRATHVCGGDHDTIDRVADRICGPAWTRGLPDVAPEPAACRRRQLVVALQARKRERRGRGSGPAADLCGGLEGRLLCDMLARGEVRIVPG